MPDDPSILHGAFKSRRMLEATETAMAGYLASFDALAQRLLDGDRVTIGETTQSLVAVAKMRLQLIEGIRAYEKHAFHANGADGGPDLDLDALRDEVGRRLDRLRAARGAGGVS